MPEKTGSTAECEQCSDGKETLYPINEWHKIYDPFQIPLHQQSRLTNLEAQHAESTAENNAGKTGPP